MNPLINFMVQYARLHGMHEKEHDPELVFDSLEWRTVPEVLSLLSLAQILMCNPRQDHNFTSSVANLSVEEGKRRGTFDTSYRLARL